MFRFLTGLVWSAFPSDRTPDEDVRGGGWGSEFDGSLKALLNINLIAAFAEFWPL